MADARSEEAPAGVMTPARMWTIAGLVIVSVLLSQFERQTLSALAPTVTKALKFNEVQYGVLAAAFSMSYVVTAPIAARIMDKYGARLGLAVAVALWAVASGLHSMASTFQLFVALRIALGAAESPTVPGATQLLQKILPPHQRARAFGFMFTGGSAGQALAAPLAVFFAATWGWRYGFLGTAAVSLLWIPIWLYVTRPVAAILDAQPVKPAAKKTPDADAKPIWKYRAVWRCALVVAAFSPSSSLIVLWGAKLLVRHYALTQVEVGKYLWLPAVALDVGAVVIGDIVSRRRKARKRFRSERGLVALAATCILAIILVPRMPTIGMALVVIAIVKLGAGGLLTLAISEHTPKVPPERVSIIGSAVASSQALMFVLASLLTGKLVQATKSYELMATLCAAWVIPCILAWFMTAPRRVKRKKAAAAAERVEEDAKSADET